MAVIPTEGKIVSPADAQIVSVADTGHAYGLKTEEGVELLIHVGLETVSLKGECFKIHVKPGDTVKAGDLLAEVDLEFLEERKINPITPVLICGGMEGRVLVKSQPGQVEAGKSVLLTEITKENLKDEQKTQTDPSDNLENSAPEPKSEKKKLSINFDFLQKLGKVLMAVIAVMPAAGLMISLGKLVQMAGADMSMIFTVGSTMESIGWAIINISTLSFLGLGVQAPTPEWGAMLSEAKNVLTSNPAQMLVPGIAIVILVSAFNLMGDAIRDVLDPKEVL